MKPYSEQLLTFIQEHPSVYHVIDGQRRMLLEAGYTQLSEGSRWDLRRGGKYFVIRNDSSLAAFRVPRLDFRGFMIIAAHSDSPFLKIKENPEIPVEGKYTRLNVEKYGGALLSPWFDRPLSVAGRIMVRDGNRVLTRLVNIPRDLLLIPSLAIHMDRSANEGHPLKIQKEMLPLFALGGEASLLGLIAPALLSGLSAATNHAQQQNSYDMSGLLSMFGGQPQQQQGGLLSQLFGAPQQQQQTGGLLSQLLGGGQVQQQQSGGFLSQLFGAKPQQQVQQIDGTALLQALLSLMK